MRLSLKVNGRSYPVPLSWEDVTVKQFMDLQAIDQDLSENEFTLNVLSILLSLPLDLLKDIPLSKVQEIEQVLSFVNTTPSPKRVKGFKFNGIEYRLINLDTDSLPVGVFIDLDIYTVTDPIANLNKIAVFSM